MQTKMDRRISEAYCYGTRQQLLDIQTELLDARKKAGEFMDMFLEKYDAQMSHPLTPTDHPMWKLFRSKHEAYGELERYCKSVEYFLAK